ncbi:hypothetical protein ACH5RR_018547 [Cinchona calisaya]|uniref:Reverse transcriptase Ty1/copia-type domain-containing protein n=1 Tax=Cinchona calisaya TaxID=153742 RepID=A0ABD2ZRX3_9GENT
MFTRHSNEGKIAILIVYVDDIILTGDDTAEMERLKSKLASEFEIKDLGSLKYFLGMEVARSKRGIEVSQRKYILDLLKEIGMSECRPAETPIDPNKKFGNKKWESSGYGTISKISWEAHLSISYSARHCFCSKSSKSVLAFSSRRTSRGCLSHS